MRNKIGKEHLTELVFLSVHYEVLIYTDRVVDTTVKTNRTISLYFQRFNLFIIKTFLYVNLMKIVLKIICYCSKFEWRKVNFFLDPLKDTKSWLSRHV